MPFTYRRGSACAVQPRSPASQSRGLPVGPCRPHTRTALPLEKMHSGKSYCGAFCDESVFYLSPQLLHRLEKHSHIPV